MYGLCQGLTRLSVGRVSSLPHLLRDSPCNSSLTAGNSSSGFHSAPVCLAWGYENQPNRRGVRRPNKHFHPEWRKARVNRVGMHGWKTRIHYRLVLIYVRNCVGTELDTD